MDIQKGMYELPQAGKNTNDTMKINLAKFGYETSPITPGLWQNQIHPLQFALLLDDSGVKYEHQEDITHLLDAQNN